MGQCRPLFVYFRPFLVTISIIKSVDGVHGVQTRGRMMVVADKTTELWQPPNKIIILLNAIHRQLHLYFIEHQQNNFLQRVNLIFQQFQILTKDSVTVHVDAIMYYKVYNAISAISNVDDYGQSTRLLAATTLRSARQGIIN